MFSRQCFLASVLGVLAHAQNQASVLTWHNDSWRTGQNTNETHLTTGSFANNGFGLICRISLPSSPQQEQIYAQPLVVPNNDGSMNVYVATMQDNIYVFKIPATWGVQTCATLQSTTPVSLLKGPLANQYPADACFIGLGWGFQTCSAPNGGRAICPSVGILGTPVIEPIANIMYVVTESQATDTEPEGANCLQPQPKNFYHYLHALDLSPSNFPERDGERTGANRPRADRGRKVQIPDRVAAPRTPAPQRRTDAHFPYHLHGLLDDGWDTPQSQRMGSGF